MLLIEERWAEINAPNFTFDHGSHTSIKVGACAMEAVAYVFGQRWSACPDCTCVVIAQFLRSWNDRIADKRTRTRLLRPLVPKLAGTRVPEETSTYFERVDAMLKWFVFEHVVTLLRLHPRTHQQRRALCRMEAVTPACLTVLNDAIAMLRDDNGDQYLDAGIRTVLMRTGAETARHVINDRAQRGTFFYLDMTTAAWDASWWAIRAFVTSQSGWYDTQPTYECVIPYVEQLMHREIVRLQRLAVAMIENMVCPR